MIVAFFFHELHGLFLPCQVGRGARADAGCHEESDEVPYLWRGVGTGYFRHASLSRSSGEVPAVGGEWVHFSERLYFPYCMAYNKLKIMYLHQIVLDVCLCVCVSM